MSDFSLYAYHELLRAFKNASYTFCSFEDVDHSVKEGLPFVVLRHDIDISLRPALEIAHIEHEQKIQATYFITLHSPFYNALSNANAEIISQIYLLGHQIALHADLTSHNGDYAKALLEIDVFAKFYPYINCAIASLHSPSNLEHIPIDSYKQLQYIYGHTFNQNVAYISDSTGRWRYGHPLDSEAFYARKPIQLLTHPIWWVQEGETAAKKLECWLHRDYLNTVATAHEFLPKLLGANKSLQKANILEE
jgi:hypothetical protein